MRKTLYLSHLIDHDTPTYGNRHRFILEKNSSIERGDVANDSFIETTVHIGTHIDMPYHFHDNGQTIEDFSSDFWVFEKVTCVEISVDDNFMIGESLLKNIDQRKIDSDIEMLIVKTGFCTIRDKEDYWKNNPGFEPFLYEELRERFQKLRILGFDSISISSFANRSKGREAHKTFLNPLDPILLLEDMSLSDIHKDTIFVEVVVAPMLISKCDGLPCTVIAKIAER